MMRNRAHLQLPSCLKQAGKPEPKQLPGAMMNQGKIFTNTVGTVHSPLRKVNRTPAYQSQKRHVKNGIGRMFNIHPKYSLLLQGAEPYTE